MKIQNGKQERPNIFLKGHAPFIHDSHADHMNTVLPSLIFFCRMAYARSDFIHQLIFGNELEHFMIE